MALVTDRCEFPLLRNRFWPNAVRHTRAAECRSPDGASPPPVPPVCPRAYHGRHRAALLMIGSIGAAGNGSVSDAALDGPQPDGSSSPRQPGRSHGAAWGGDGSARRTLGVQSLDVGMLTRAEATAADGSSPPGPDADAFRCAARLCIRLIQRASSGARGYGGCNSVPSVRPAAAASASPP